MMKLFDAIRADSAGFWGQVLFVLAWIASGFYLWNKLPIEANGIFSFAMASFVERGVLFVVRVHKNLKD